MSDFPELSGADFSGISQRGTLVVGFSGGADSTVLLHCLLEAAGSRDRIVLAHVNHGLRGAEADRDEAFCREQASAGEIHRATEAACGGQPGGN